MDNTIIIILLMVFGVMLISSASSSIGGGYYYYNQQGTSSTTPSPATTIPSSKTTQPSSDTTTQPSSDTTTQPSVQTCTTTNQADGKCRTYWDCYLGDSLISGGESIDWGHTAKDAAWACNEWKKDKCNGQCIAKYRSDLTSNPSEQAAKQTSSPSETCQFIDGKCRTAWYCYLDDKPVGGGIGIVPKNGITIDWGHTSGDAAWACNNWELKSKCNGNCTAKFSSQATQMLAIGAKPLGFQ